MRRLPAVTAAYAACHFMIDFGCAYAYFSACGQGSLGFLLYNFCAFALQMPLGVLADRRGRGRGFAVLGGVIVSGMCFLPSFGLWGCAVLGLGNGLFHIGGGLDVLCLSGDRAGPLGIFVSPGAIGLYLGTLAGTSGFSSLAAGGLVLLWTLIVLFACTPYPLPRPVPLTLPPSWVVPPAALLFAVVLLRSFGGLAGSFSWKAGLFLPLAAVAVSLGKAAGGFAVDHAGPRVTGLSSLTVAGLLFLLGGDSPAAGMLALFSFQMTMPLTLWALARLMPGCKAFSFGLLTFALFLGFVPVYLGWSGLSGPALGLLALVSCPLLLAGLGRRRAR